MTSSRRLMLVSAVMAFSVFKMVSGKRNPDIRRSQARLHHASFDPHEYSSLYVSNLDPQVSEEKLNKIFSDFGKISSLVLAKDFKGESRGFGFIDYEISDDARHALKHINGTKLGRKVLHLERTTKKEEGRDQRRQMWFW